MPATIMTDWEARSVPLPKGPAIREVVCRSALSPSGLKEIDYALNPYVGCQHGCTYCYAPAVIREERRWGVFVDIRRNMPNVLASELRRLPRGTVALGTVTDAYQPVEERAQVTRRCLEVLLRSDWPVTIQTKSHLVVRDIDVLTRFGTRDVGMSITCTDDSLRRIYEPGGSVLKDKLMALTRLSDAGISTWVYVGPLLPGLTDRGLGIEGLVGALAGAGVRKIYCDKLRFHPGVASRFQPTLEAMPGLAATYAAQMRGDETDSCRLATELEGAVRARHLEFQSDF